MQEVRYADRAAFAAGVAETIARALQAALRERARASLVVPGGSTPGPVFDCLAGMELDWARVDITLSDERWVPSSDADSNQALVSRRLLRDRAVAATLLGLYRAQVLPSAAVGNLPVARRASDQVICLPIYPDLRDEDAQRVVEVLRAG